MKKKFNEPTSPFQNLESHFLNVFHAGVYISAQELMNIGKAFNIDVALKNREIIIKNLLNSANEKDVLADVMRSISSLIQERIKQLNHFALEYPDAAPYLQMLIQKSTSTDLLLKREQRANPYE